MDPILTFIVVLVIGIVVGIAAQRFMARGWFHRELAGGTRADVTASLVGIAGAFIGFHLVALMGMISIGAVLLGALIGAIVIVFIWRQLR